MASLAATLLWLWPSTVFAQEYPIPFEAAVGLGVLNDHSLSQWAPTLVGAFSWDYDENWWAVPVLEGEVAATGEAEPCQRSSSDASANCVDAAVLGGLRFRQTPHASSGVRPFAHVLLGNYWIGSGTDEQEFISDHFATQVGGGVEVRWAESIQGVRMSVEFRRVFAGARDRNQIRFLCAYVIGPRRFTRRPG
jgi:hypothetical protein